MFNRSTLLKCFVCFLGVLLIGFFFSSNSDARLPDGPGVLKLVFGSEVLIYENVGGILNSTPHYLEFFVVNGKGYRVYGDFTVIYETTR